MKTQFPDDVDRLFVVGHAILVRIPPFALSIMGEIVQGAQREKSPEKSWPKMQGYFRHEAMLVSFYGAKRQQGELTP